MLLTNKKIHPKHEEKMYKQHCYILRIQRCLFTQYCRIVIKINHTYNTSTFIHWVFNFQVLGQVEFLQKH